MKSAPYYHELQGDRVGEAPSNDSDREDMGRDSNRSDIEPHDVAPEAGLLEVATSSSVLFSTGLAWDCDEPSISFQSTISICRERSGLLRNYYEFVQPITFSQFVRR